VNVDKVAVGKVVVDDEVDTFEVHATTHDIRTDENPDCARSETTNYCITLHTQALMYVSACVLTNHNPKLYAKLNTTQIYITK